MSGGQKLAGKPSPASGRHRPAMRHSSNPSERASSAIAVSGAASSIDIASFKTGRIIGRRSHAGHMVGQQRAKRRTRFQPRIPIAHDGPFHAHHRYNPDMTNARRRINRHAHIITGQPIAACNKYVKYSKCRLRLCSPTRTTAIRATAAILGAHKPAVNFLISYEATTS